VRYVPWMHNAMSEINYHYFGIVSPEYLGFLREHPANTVRGDIFIKLTQSKKLWLTHSYISYRLNLASIIIIEVK